MDFSFENLLKQEQQLVLPEFNSEIAYKIGMAIIERAKEEGKIIAVSVTAGRQIIFHYAMDGLSPDSDNWIRRKSNIVYEYHKSSMFLGVKFERDGSTLEAHGRDPRDFKTNGGSFPIRVKGAPNVIGAITVTGLPDRDDHEYVVTALAKHLSVEIK